MLNMKKIVLATAVAGAACFAASANAATQSFNQMLGNITTPFSTNIGNSIDVGNDSFDAITSFSITDAVDIANANVIVSLDNFSFNVELSSVTMELFSVGTPAPIEIGHNVGNIVYFLSPKQLVAGDYYIEVKGDVVNPSEGASYGGNLTIQAVPEPGEWAMMLAGLGIMGSMVRRRSRNV